jgi:hypothetical protein
LNDGFKIPHADAAVGKFELKLEASEPADPITSIIIETSNSLKRAIRPRCLPVLHEFAATQFRPFLGRHRSAYTKTA